MAASGRRGAIWPYLVMPLVVIVVFYALWRVHKPATVPHAPAAIDTTQ
jgi:hypothetical protein